jgi:hypothetical protein
MAHIPRQLLSITLHIGYPTLTKSHNLTGFTPVVKLTNAHRYPICSQNQQSSLASPPVAKPTELTGISHVAKSRIMHTGFASAAYHEPNQLDPDKPNQNHHNHTPTNRVKGPCHSWSRARLSWQFTLCRCYTTLPTDWWFHHPSVTKSLHFAQHILP